jgi:hypothetical protein
MTTQTRESSLPKRHAFELDWRQGFLAILVAVLIVVAFGLAIIGLDALNDVLVRGFASLPG